MIDIIKNNIKQNLIEHFNKMYKIEVESVLEIPKGSDNGDLSLPLFIYSKKIGKSPKAIFDEVKHIFDNIVGVEEIQNKGGFLNIYYNKKILTKKIVLEVNKKGSLYGSNDIGIGKVVCIDYSSPNIAKSFNIGHLRGTVIGHSLKKINEKVGFEVIGINHLGDWGTQFGKLIHAYKEWVDEKNLKENALNELMRIYVKFQKELEKNNDLIIKARNEFNKLENNDQENIDLWKKFKDISMEDFLKVYKLLGVEFDYYLGESFYVDKTDKVLKELNDKNLLIEDDNALVVEIDENQPPMLLQKSDGSTLYSTRDIAALFYRKEEYKFSKMLYVVGNEQSLHFSQIKELTKLMGYEFYNEIEHVNFGLVLNDGKKMSTRKGKSVKLLEVIDASCDLAKKYIETKNPTLENKDEISKKIGLSAILFNDLKSNRINDVEFNLDNLIKFEGQTGPYIQYTAVRIKSIIKNQKIDLSNIDENNYLDNYSFELLKFISSFKETVLKASIDSQPSYISKYILKLSSLFSSYYTNIKVNVVDEIEKNSKLALINSVLIILEEGMSLLGMMKIERM